MICRFLKKPLCTSFLKRNIRFLSANASISDFDSPNPISNAEFRTLMENCKMNPYNSKKLVVAVSGGPDSMALLSLLGEWTMKENLIAVTIDHGFRKESEKEAEQVHEWVSKMQIQHITKKIDWSSYPNNKPTPKQMENEGRLQRYQILKSICKEYNTSDVLVAHHGDDQIETFLMRLYRSSGYAGLACMRPIQIMEDGTRRIRPFLKISKQRLLATCSSLSIPYVLDPSNTDLQFDRNRVRYGILQIRDKKLMNIQSILQVIDYFQLIRDAEESVLKDVFISCCEYNRDLGIARLNCQIVSNQSLPLIQSIIKTVCFGIGGSLNPSENAVKRIATIIQTTKGLAKPMQVAGCVLSELKLGSSVYSKKNKEMKWICVCLDRNQLLAKNIQSRSIPLPRNQEISFLNQYQVSVKEISQKTTSLITISPLPFIKQLPSSTKLTISFIPDSIIQGFLCSNRGILTRRNLSNLIARSIPAIFAEINGKTELIYSNVFKVNRVENLTCSIKALPKPVFQDIHPWVIH